ncbi:MAG TPA: hypothetical protein GXX46_11600 [Peptococcaceae bacterium]|nr:hypothetical protein [Peptococcaceae bacterium]
MAKNHCPPITTGNCHFLNRELRKPGEEIGFFSYPKPSFSLSTPYIKDDPNLLLLTPAIFGSAGAFLLGFGFYGHCLTGGYNKFIFFIIVLAVIASLGGAAYIYQVRLVGSYPTSLSTIILASLLIIFFFGTVYNLIYSLYPATFSGTIGDTPLTQLLSFLSLSVGVISVGETFNVAPEKPEVQILEAIEALFNLFALSLIISVVAS